MYQKDILHKVFAGYLGFKSIIMQIKTFTFKYNSTSEAFRKKLKRVFYWTIVHFIGKQCTYFSLSDATLKR